MNKELERTKEALREAQGALALIADMWGVTPAVKMTANSVLSTINAILNPPPEMEEVEVVRYAAITPRGEQHDSCEHKSSLVGLYGNKEGWAIIPLTGTYQRAKKQPVERSVSAKNVDLAGTGVVIETANDARFKDFPECHGKTGTLTFAWQE